MSLDRKMDRSGLRPTASSSIAEINEAVGHVGSLLHKVEHRTGRFRAPLFGVLLMVHPVVFDNSMQWNGMEMN